MGEKVKAVQSILNLLFPNRCVFCGEILPEPERACPDCIKRLIPFQDMEWPRQKDTGFLDQYQCGYLYVEPVPRAVGAFKFKDRPQLAGYFADLMVEQMGEWISRLSLDWVCSVPMHPAKEKKRGYNQADLLARELSLRIGAQYEPRLLIKIVDNQIQHRLSAEQRKKNVRDVYEAGAPEQIMKKRILLVDDIMTTGSTMNECARVLRLEGAEAVFGAAFARPARLPEEEAKKAGPAEIGDEGTEC